MTQITKRRPRSPREAARRTSPLDEFLEPGLFKALGDPTRAKLLACMAKCGRPCSVSEVAECCDVDFSVVSRHLALLERAGVVAGQKAGRVVRYRVRFAELSRSLRSLAEALDQCRPDPRESCEADACCK